MTDQSKKRAVFIDRDGVLVAAYAGRPANTVDEVKLLLGVPDAINIFKSLNLLTVCVSNQGGVGLGFMTLDVLKAQNERLNDLLVLAKSHPLDASYWCPHRPSDGCWCRKPNPGMLTRAAEDLGIDLSSSYMVGDQASDMDAGLRAGVPTRLMVVSDRYQDSPHATRVFGSLRDAAMWVAMAEVNLVLAPRVEKTDDTPVSVEVVEG